MNKFVQKLHEEFETPIEVLFDLVKRATNEDPIGVERIVGGYENEVYKVATRHANFAVRIRRLGNVGFQHEAWAIDSCHRAGVPVPEVLLVDTIQSGEKPLEAMVQNWIAGRPLDDVLGEIAQRDLDRILHQIGELLAGIHSIPVEGVGRRHAEDHWDFSTWDQMTASQAQNRDSKKEYILQADFSEQDFEAMLQLLRQNDEEFPCSHPVLCHGDFDPQHIFVNENLNVSGVIDFGQIQGGPPILDFMFFSLARPEMDLTPILSRYPDPENQVEDRFERRLNMCRLGFLMGCVAHITKTGDVDADKTPDAPGQLKKTLEILRSEL